MMADLNEESKRIGLKMNKSKTKVIYNRHCQRQPIEIGGEIVQEVEEYVYLGQLITSDGNMEKEINRRIGLGWAAYSKHREVIESNIPLCLKRKIINQIVLPSITYGSETWRMSKEVKKKLLVTQEK